MISATCRFVFFLVLIGAGVPQPSAAAEPVASMLGRWAPEGIVDETVTIDANTVTVDFGTGRTVLPRNGSALFQFGEVTVEALRHAHPNAFRIYGNAIAATLRPGQAYPALTIRSGRGLALSFVQVTVDRIVEFEESRSDPPVFVVLRRWTGAAPAVPRVDMSAPPR